MRLMQKDLKPVHLFAAQEVESGYVGTVTKWNYTDTVQCNIQPADNKITAEVYGERVYNMISLLCPLDCGITEAVRLSPTSKEAPDYKVVSIKTYITHIAVLAEKLVLEPYTLPENNTEQTQDYGFYPR